MTPAGAKAPINYAPDPEKGNTLLLSPNALGEELLSVVLTGDALELARRQTPVYLFLNHWASCPDRAEWRERTDAQREAGARGLIGG